MMERRFDGQCILCGSERIVDYRAGVSPFVAKRIWNVEPFNVALRYCKDCDFAYFVPRPTDYELSHLYNGYRDEEYLKQRAEYEPGYVNPDDVAVRRERISKIFRNAFDPATIRSVLDYGGDRGQMIPDIFPNAEKYVYEPHEVIPAPGVAVLHDGEIRKVDLIMCCHVLEHVPSPNDVVARIRDFCHYGTTLFFEVPYDTPLGTGFDGFIRKTVFSIPPVLERYNRIRGNNPDDPRLYMHEHINYFSPKALWRLLFRHGIRSDPRVEMVAGVKTISSLCQTYENNVRRTDNENTHNSVQIFLDWQRRYDL